MKKHFLIILWAGLILFGLTNCEEKPNTETAPEEAGEISAEAVVEVMTWRFTATELAGDFFNEGLVRGERRTHQAGERRRHEGHRSAANLGLIGRRGEAGTGGHESDTARHEDGTDWWETCAEITETENEDGSFTIIFDWGEGCQEGRAFVSGKIKITESGSEDGRFRYEIVFEDYSETYENDTVSDFEKEGFTLNGFYVSEGVYDEPVLLEAHEGEMTITFADGSWESFAVSGETRETPERFEVLRGTFEGSNSDGDSFSGAVTETLALDFNCGEEVFVFTSGKEEWLMNNTSVHINYGDGTCDNIIVITTNGQAKEIDLSEDWRHVDD